MTLLLGLGIIGSRSADQLTAANIPLKTWNRTPKDRPDSVDDPAQAAADADVIVCYLMDEKAVREVFTRIAPSLTEGKTFINHATIDVDTTLWLDQQCRDLGCDFLDCPFTGSRDAATGGNLVYYVSGDPAVVEKHRPLLEITSREIVFLGPPPAATVVKITTNHVTASVVQAMTEAVEISRRYGVDPRAWHEAAKLNGCYAGAIGMKIPTLLEGDYTPHFSAKNMLKDVTYSRHLAKQSGVKTPVANRVGAQLRSAEGELQEKDFSVIQLAQQGHPEFPKIINLSPRGIIRVTGPDAKRFLNGQISNDVALTDSGDSIAACVLNMKGQLEAFIRVMQHEGTYYLDTELSQKDVLLQRLDRYLIADDVELTDVSTDFHLVHSRSQSITDKGAVSARSNRFGIVAFDTLIPVKVSQYGPWRFARREIESYRILNGIPKWPNELFPGLLPPEAGLEESAVSYTKGCYTGQEVISRMKRAGKVNRKLVKLTLDKPLIPTKSLLQVDGKEAGIITSVAAIAPDQEIALGYLKRKFEDATEFQIASPYNGDIIGSATLR
ncbi:MAG: NAD(P)-binding domain-containing protein [Verrucomicrobiaceae bacterium]